MNEASCRYFGGTKEELTGTSFIPLISDEDQAAVLERLSVLNAEQPVSGGEHRAIKPDGTTAWQEWLDHAIFDDSGNITEVQSIGRDITERKQVEEEREELDRQLDRAQKVQAIGLLAGTMPSDFGNIVCGIVGYTALIMDGMPEGFHVSLAIHQPDTNQLAMYSQKTFRGSKPFQPLMLPLDGHPVGLSFTRRKSLMLGRLDATAFPTGPGQVYMKGLRSLYCLPLESGKRVWGTMNVGGRDVQMFDEDDRALFDQVAKQVTLAVENALAFQEIADLRNKLTEEKLYLENEIRADHNFDKIIGESRVLKEVLRQVETVAPTDSTVLIQGETGTGKELIARAIHDLSTRQKGTFVKLNCSAIPAGLLESELFGHERGAFTGAIARKVGRFELADHGTLFLDEVGDIPPELQPKLLRVLQEQEFERLGGIQTIRTNVRLVAATNRDLTEMVSSGAFRQDLYYRLNVFPVRVPPLRGRTEDIPPLLWHFTRRIARRMHRTIDTIPTDTMDRLVHYQWPGNIRELENLVERSVILSQGSRLQLPIGELETNLDVAGTSMESVERNHIVRVLDESNWVVGGPNGAATRLGMKRTTLQSRMEKLGISKRR